MDQQKLRTLVFEKTGIKIDTTDPVFALVALNECILEETLQRHLALVRESAHGPASAVLHGAHLSERQPAFKSSRDNWEAEEEQSPPAATPAGAAEPATTEHGELSHQLDGAGKDGDTAASGDFRAQPTPARATHFAAPAAFDRRLLLLAAAMSVSTAVMVLAGQAWLATGKNAVAITAEQRAQLQQSEKLNKAIEKLDAKTKAQLQTEMNKP